jgi:RHS repeat-associated protein
MPGAPGLDLQTWDYAYDARPIVMTLSATCAIGEVWHRPSHYRAEQYDQDLNLYYLRARYYNPATGRFIERDPLDGYISIPVTLHKYLYAGGDPVDEVDPTGRATYTNPANQTAGGALSEYAGLALDSLNRVAYFVQSTLPEWLGTPAGKVAVATALTALGAVEEVVCEVEPSCSPTPTLPNGGPGTGAVYPVYPYTPGQVTGQELTDTLDRPF